MAIAIGVVFLVGLAGLGYLFWWDASGPTVYGTVVRDTSFQGSGQITSQGLGGSNGQTAAIPYTILTVAYDGQNYTITLTCNFYTAGSQIPIATANNGQILPQYTTWNSDSYNTETSVLQPGCVMIGEG